LVKFSKKKKIFKEVLKREKMRKKRS